MSPNYLAPLNSLSFTAISKGLVLLFLVLSPKCFLTKSGSLANHLRPIQGIASITPSDLNDSFCRNNILGSNLFSFNYLKTLLHCALAVSAAVEKSNENLGPVLCA